jgi:cell wall-associated NlpC family hydrolase
VRERGQVSVAAVAAIAVVLLGGVLLGYLSMVAAGGGRAQRAADLAAVAAARSLAADPDANAADLRRVAAGVARRNGARLVTFRVVRDGPIPRAVDLSVAIDVDGSVPVAGRQSHEVDARARAGVDYSASLAAAAFRPVDLHGGRGPLAAVAAAEAQVGWPYVWGGESRADGGFDCSGLIDYAYAAAGDPLPGRPTAADLWHDSRPVSAAELLPGDLAFVGTGSGAPHHVGMYVGGGTVVVAPHTGADVRFEPLAAGGWDGFGRLVGGGSVAVAADPAVEAAARARQVPPHARAAELRLGLARDPDAAAAALAAGMRRHPGDLAGALGDALGDRSAAALVLRSASGAGLSDFSGAVRLLPIVAAAVRAVGATVAGPDAADEGPESTDLLGTAEKALERGGEQGDHLGSRLSVQAAAGFRNLARFGLTAAATFLPDPHLRDVATFAGAAWDGVESGLAIARGGVELAGPSLWATRLTAPLGLGFSALFAYQAWTARRREDRVWYGAQAASSALTSAGAMTAGLDLVTLGAGTAEVPPVGAALMLAGVTVLGAACVYRERHWLAGGARRAAGAVLDAGRSIAGALNPFSV